MAGTLKKFKTFFAEGKDAKPLTNTELMALRREDATGYDELRDLASAQVDKNPSMYEGVEV